MKQSMRLGMQCAALMACISAFGQSNPIEGGTTETVTNVWNVPLPWLIVGGNSDSNALIVSDGGQVNNAIGYIGNAVTSTDNSALVTGAGSAWNNTLELSVGHQGAGNSLTVADGGTVASPNAYIGNNSDGNAVIVTGSNSLLDAAVLNVGYQGDDNHLLVTDGGTVESDTGTLGYWINSDGNTATVQSNGNWNSSMELNVGEYGSDNRLVVGAGGLVDTPVVNVGVQSISSNNTVTVAGEGAWLNAPELYIGGSASGAGAAGNLVEVENGGTVYTESLNIYSNNAFDLNDGGRLFINTNFNASMADFNFNAGGTLEVGGELTGMTNSIEDQRGLVLNGSNAVWDVSSSDIKVGESTAGSGLSIVNGGAVYSDNGYIGYSAGADSNSVVVSGTDSVWQNDRNVYIGYDGAGNNLIVQDGGQVLNTYGFIGTGSDSNSVLVTGSGSVLNNSAGLVIGYNGGSGNSLTIEGGGRVETDVAAIGFQSDNNSALVTGNGSVWNSSEIFVGLTGANNNRLTVDNGGRVEASSGGIGDWSDNNSALVTGTGSVWTNSGDFVVGREGSYNTLNIVDSGAVYNDNGYIGYSVGADSNSVLVTGAGSEWINGGDLTVGNLGYGNALSITNGGLVENTDGYIGYGVMASGNEATVSGDGSVWHNADQLHVGYNGSDNALRIEDGGQVCSVGGSTIGFGETASSNRVIVTGEDASWIQGLAGAQLESALLSGLTLSKGNYLLIGTNGTSNQIVLDGGSTLTFEPVQSAIEAIYSDLVVGHMGSYNTLEVESGGLVTSYNGIIGETSNAWNNTVSVSGTNSEWRMMGDLYLGYHGSDSTLTIADGGRVENAMGYIGYSSGANNNSLQVSGADSVLTNSAGLHVGFAGANNSLLIEDGGRVDSLAGYIGYGETADGNAVTVTGAGSLWDSTESYLIISNQTIHVRYAPVGLNVGYHGSGNRLTVSEGGQVDSTVGYIGYDVTASGNLATVTGRGSLWDNTGQLYVGYNGSGNTLRIEDGGYVHAQWGSAIGYGESANGNHVVVTGENSVWGSGWGGARLIEVQPPIVFPPPIDWPPISAPFPTNDPPIWIWPGITNGPPALTNYPVNPQPPYVVYSGSGSVLTVGGELGVGTALSNNLIIITNGVSVVGGEGTLLPFNNQLTVSSGGFVAGSGGSTLILTNMGTAGFATNSSIIGSDLTNGVVHQSVLIDGPVIVISNEVSIVTNYITFQPVTAIRMYASMGDLAVGRGGSDNLLEISDGALVANYHGIIGEMSNAWNNAVSVVGTNSEWRNAGDLYIGGRMSQVSYLIDDEWFSPWVDGGRGNSLYIADGGLVSVGSDMHNRNYSMLNLDPGGLVTIGGDYYQDDTAMLRFGVETNTAGAPINALITVGGTAEFEEGAQIEYASNVGELLFDRFYTNKLIEADALVVAGITNPDSLDLEWLDASGSLVDVIFWENDQDIYALAGRKYLADSAGFVEGSMMARLSKEIDDMSLLGNTDALDMIYLLNTLSGSEQNEQLVRQYEYTTPSYLHVQGMTEGLGELAKQLSRRPAPAPEGAAGPYSVDREARGWIRSYGNWSDRSDQDGFSGYDHNVYGTLVGMDWIQDNVLLGVAGGYARSKIKQDDGGDSKADTGYGVFFASVGTKDWFGDINVAFGRSDIDDDSDTVFGGQADYNANNFALYMGGGKEMRSRSGRFSFTPEASLLLSEYDQESYSEKMGTGVAREVEDYDRSSVVSSLGAAVAMQQEYDEMILRPEARVRWLHEFEDDEEKLDFTLSEGMGGQYFSLMPAAEEDILEVGTGITCTFHDEFSLALDIDWRFGEDYDAYSVSGRAVYEF